MTKSEDPTEQVIVDLNERSYPIFIGDRLIEDAGRLIAQHVPARKAAIVSDKTVAEHHLSPLMKSLSDHGFDCTNVVLPPGEQTKSFASLESVLDQLLADGIERADLVVALGGGVIGDLTGCAAGLLRRGVRFVQIPTSLLAQVDSSVGGKTGINSRHGKNLIGLFNQPHLVIADTAVLDTMSERDFRAGYAEVAKYGLLGDAVFFEWLEDNWQDVFRGGAARRYAVAQSCRAKAAIVAEDEHEHGKRALLNLGHTFGHALEGATGYSERLVHGEGVSIGMSMAFRFSAAQGLIGSNVCGRAIAHLEKVGLPTEAHQISGPPLEIRALMDHIHQDKKVEAGALTFILVRDIGDAFIEKNVDPQTVESFLAGELKRQ